MAGAAFCCTVIQLDTAQPHKCGTVYMSELGHRPVPSAFSANVIPLDPGGWYRPLRCR